MSRLLLATAIAALLSSSSLAQRARTLDPYKATVAIVHQTMRRMPMKRPCGDSVYAYLVKNVDLIRAVVIGESSMALSLTSGHSVQVTRVVGGGAGFIDLNAQTSLYVFVDLAHARVTLGIIKRGASRTEACAEKLTANASYPRSTP